MARVLVGMSGGVDSSVAAALLARAGHEVIGVSLQIYDHSAGGRTARCCSPADFLDARRVADRFGFRYYVLNREEAFTSRVLDDFVDEYLRGRTPNPCVRCNAEVKFETLAALARDLDAQAIATGHYARLSDDETTGERWLLRARDRDKDQSYFLFDLTPEQICLAMFPLGEMTKDDVRALARELGLGTADKPDSQDVCFVEGGDYRGFVSARMAQRGLSEDEGEMLDAVGNAIGRHRGLSHYTIGQRRGLGVAASRRLYVIGIDPAANTVRLGSEEDLACRSLRLTRVRFHGATPHGGFETLVKARYRHPGIRGWVTPDDRGGAQIDLCEDLRGAAPGQAAVFYDDDRVLGGGWIEAAVADRSAEQALPRHAAEDRIAVSCATIRPAERA
jgi:tRNA-uridine 2-sulfurtransferase